MFTLCVRNLEKKKGEASFRSRDVKQSLFICEGEVLEVGMLAASSLEQPYASSQSVVCSGNRSCWRCWGILGAHFFDASICCLRPDSQKLR